MTLSWSCLSAQLACWLHNHLPPFRTNQKRTSPFSSTNPHTFSNNHIDNIYNISIFPVFSLFKPELDNFKWFYICANNYLRLIFWKMMKGYKEQHLTSFCRIKMNKYCVVNGFFKRLPANIAFKFFENLVKSTRGIVYKEVSQSWKNKNCIVLKCTKSGIHCRINNRINFRPKHKNLMVENW